jgi:hypothetical protein
VMELMENVYRDSGLQEEVKRDATGEEWRFVKGLMMNVEEQHVKLDKEVRKYCEERGV